jgi:two-component system cell cycle response regulator
MSISTLGFGLEAADKYLASVAHAYRAAMPEEAILARIGGDEVVAVLLDQPLSVARDRALRAQAKLAAISGEVKTTLSIGVSGWVLAKEPALPALERAASALHHAKARGPGHNHIDGIDDPPPPDAPQVA